MTSSLPAERKPALFDPVSCAYSSATQHLQYPTTAPGQFMG
jgi:hypothetical protein